MTRTSESIFLVFCSAQPPLQPAPKGSREFSIFLAVGVGLLLLGLSLYLMFRLQKKQILREQLKAVRRQAKMLFDEAPCGFHTLDERGYFASVNATFARWLGYEREELVGKLKLADLVWDAEASIPERNELLSRGPQDVMLKKKDGEPLPVVLSALRHGEEEEPERWLYATLDNSRCWEALERMESLDRELEAFSYSISHDLRAPLRSIDGYSKILREDYAGNLDDEGKRVLGVIMNNARRMGNLIDDLLEFGRLGRKNLQKSELNMKGIVDGIVQDLLAREPDRTIDFSIGDLSPAFADADMMQQVWFNLLENAVKYTGRKNRAQIDVRSTTSDKGELVYLVKDNGEGFDMRYSHKLFGVFQRLHKIQDFPGTGVGLAIVKRIIARHGGRVWGEGIPQQGATFYFTLPVASAHE